MKKAVLELGVLSEVWFTLMWLPWLIATAPQGDGHPVLVIPGFGGNADTTAVLRKLLIACNYDARDWGHGFNLGPSDELSQSLVEHLEQIKQDTGRQVSLIGWSLGGLYARYLANERSDLVRRIITLGCPHRADPTTCAIKPTTRTLFQLLSPRKLETISPEEMEKVRRTPPVAVTSIYTRTDGVVDWRDCLHSSDENAEDIEVLGTHLGLTHNYQALALILDRLRRRI